MTGVFKNTEPGKSDYIDNCDGAQAVYIFAVPQAGLFQEPVPSSARFEVGSSYTLTMGILGGKAG